MNRSFWRGKRVLITGHTGFKGSWLAAWLNSASAVVAGFALPPSTKPSLFRQLGLAEKMAHRIGDTRSFKSVLRTVRDFRPQIVFHLAAQPLVRDSYERPVETYETNVMGTINLLEAIRQSQGVRVVVNVTTDKVYANDEHGLAFTESAPLGGRDPYSSSKACSELVTQAYRDSFLGGTKGRSAVTRLATARSGNVIGGGDWSKDRLVPDLVRAFASGRTALVRYPDAVRPWQHVLEAVHGYLVLSESLWPERSRMIGAWNFGPPVRLSKTVAVLADSFGRAWGNGSEWKSDNRSHPEEAGLLVLDSRRAHRQLGWSCQLSFRETVNWTADWYKRRENGESASSITMSQLAAYEKLTKR
jgi:CDP-glucose 4,6-dehydratase